VFAAGLVFEFREGLEALRSEKLASKLSAGGKDRWKKLEAFAELTNEDTLCQIRNKLAFHIGDEDTVRKGIKNGCLSRRGSWSWRAVTAPPWARVVTTTRSRSSWPG
jgi:hypothetical protein